MDISQSEEGQVRQGKEAGLASDEKFVVRAGSIADADVIAALVTRLLGELYQDLQGMYRLERLGPVTRDVLASGSVSAFIAEDLSGDAVGIVMLNQCEAIYAFGRFGEISELYVDPGYRSCGVGAALLQSAVAHARSQGWSMLEVGAPDVPRWQKTVDFYERNGFATVGPRLYLPLD